MGRFLVSIVLALFISACSESSDSNVSNVGSNGLPVSMSVYPDIKIIGGTDDREPKITRADITANTDSSTASVLQQNLVHHGFTKTGDLVNQTTVSSHYVKDNASCVVFKITLDGRVYNGAQIVVSEADKGVDLSKVYTYFQPVLNKTTHIIFIYDHFDVATLNSYISALETAGFKQVYTSKYVLNQYTFYSISDSLNGYRLEFTIKE